MPFALGPLAWKRYSSGQPCESHRKSTFPMNRKCSKLEHLWRRALRREFDFVWHGERNRRLGAYRPVSVRNLLEKLQGRRLPVLLRPRRSRVHRLDRERGGLPKVEQGAGTAISGLGALWGRARAATCVQAILPNCLHPGIKNESSYSR